MEIEVICFGDLTELVVGRVWRFWWRYLGEFCGSFPQVLQNVRKFCEMHASF
jgi:hypothetical protein